ncbi:hypothetical protein KM043_013773 [Ampulex compressa]|nr:hypothetical protein KM043_013773 [Ampulex compressa]
MLSAVGGGNILKKKKKKKKKKERAECCIGARDVEDFKVLCDVVLRPYRHRTNVLESQSGSELLCLDNQYFRLMPEGIHVHRVLSLTLKDIENHIYIFTEEIQRANSKLFQWARIVKMEGSAFQCYPPSLIFARRHSLALRFCERRFTNVP